MVWPIAKLVLQRVALLVRESSRRISKRGPSRLRGDENVKWPIANLAALFIKENVRPAVNRFSKSAKQNPQFRAVIERIAQRFHLSDFNAQSKRFNFRKPIRVKPLSADEALNLGTSLFREALIYGISAAIMLLEYDRSSKNEQIKEEKRKFEIATLQRKIYEYGMTTEQQETEIKELKRKMFDLDDKNRSLASKLFSSLKSC